MAELNAWWKMGIALVLFSAGLGVGFAVQGWRLNEKIADLQKARSDDISQQATSALGDLKKASGDIAAAAADAHTDNANLSTKLTAIQKDIKNAKPLPVDCKPDDDRMRRITSTIDAANSAIAR